MTWVDVVFFIYIFISLYMLSLFIFIYLPNKKRLFYYPKGKAEPVSLIIPCYNESESIGKTIESLLKLNYPSKMLEIIVVDDKSKDNSADVVRKYVLKHKNVRLIVNKRNSGGAAEPINIGIRSAKHSYIAVTDADSMPDPDALIKMIGFLQEDKKVGGVTCAVLAYEPKSFIQKLQSIEYLVIAFNRKLLDMVDAVYVTPGPFALYRKDILIEIGLFDTKNMTQDIEIVWKMLAHGYKARMCLATSVRSITPNKFKYWWKQRVRWNIGGTQCIAKYKSLIFKKKMLGAFVIPFFTASLFIGLFGLFLFIYLITRRIIVSYLSTKYSLYVNTAIVRLEELSFAPSILNYFGIILFILGFSFVFFILSFLKTYKLKNNNVFNLTFYMIVYLSVYSTITVAALYKMIRGKYTW